MVNGESVALCVINAMKELLGTDGEVVAIDGKTICSTEKMKSYSKSLQILTAYLTNNGVTLGQIAIYEKPNEIPMLRELLEMIDVKGKVVTADVMHCQKDTTAKITQSGADYILGVKDNQSSLHEEIQFYVDDAIACKSPLIEVAQTREKSRDRNEVRTCYATKNVAWLHQKDEWHELNSFFAIHRKVTIGNKTTEETSHYITSLGVSADKLLEYTREHWKIESMHWQLDVTFSEDECRVISVNGQKSLNVFRKLALALHKNYVSVQSKKISLKKNMLKCLLNDELLVDVLKLQLSCVCNKR